MDKETFEKHLSENLAPLERFIRFRISDSTTAEDIFQEVCLSAWAHHEELRNESSFRPWLYRIARNKLNDIYRTPKIEVQSDKLDSVAIGKYAHPLHDAVLEALSQLRKDERELLMVCYLGDKTQKEAAEMLGIPHGTLKSRLYTAREHFREAYPYKKTDRRFDNMEKNTKIKNFPLNMPEYTISQRDDEPFDVIHEAIIGWGIVPKLGEKCAWASYDFPKKVLTETMQMEVTGRAMVHGIEGVEIKTVESGWDSPDNLVFADTETERTFVAQLTDTHCRLLAESHIEDGVRKFYTFLDGADFLDNWGYGSENCGFETHITPKGNIKKAGNTVTVKYPGRQVLDICGRFDVTINGKTYDTVCLMDIETYDASVMTETYLDREGKIILWRRFNRNDWNFSRIGQLWTERLPENEVVTINGETYVHWYDCIFDNIL